MVNTVHSISSAISRSVPFDQTVQVVLRNTDRQAGLESGAVFLLDGDELVLHLAAHQGLPVSVTSHLSEVKVGDGLAGRVAEEGELLFIEDLAADSHLSAADKWSLRRSTSAYHSRLGEACGRDASFEWRAT